MAVLVGTLLPWVRTGRVTRSGLALAHSLRQAGFVDTLPRRVLFVAVELTPVLVAGAWAAAALRRPRLAAGAALLVGAVGATAAVVATNLRTVSTQGGVTATVLAALVTVGLGVVGLTQAGRFGRKAEM